MTQIVAFLKHIFFYCNFPILTEQTKIESVTHLKWALNC